MNEGSSHDEIMTLASRQCIDEVTRVASPCMKLCEMLLSIGRLLLSFGLVSSSIASLPSATQAGAAPLDEGSRQGDRSL